MLRYIEREPLSVNTSHFPLALGERIAKLDLSGRDLINVLETELRLEVAQADLDIAAGAMPKREGRWLKVAEGEPALTVHRVLRDGSGTAVAGGGRGLPVRRFQLPAQPDALNAGLKARRASAATS
jgi:GntR family transcriptional regulator